MPGIQFGPMEIFCNCDEPGCNAEAMVWTGEPEEYQATKGEPDEPLPAGWTMRDKKTYCSRHS